MVLQLQVRMKINIWPAVKQVENFFFFYHELYSDWMVLHIDLYFLSKKYTSIFFSDLIFLSVFLFPLFTVKESPATFDRLLKKQTEKMSMEDKSTYNTKYVQD